MDTIRAGVIGIGTMGTGHAERLLNGEVPGCELAAVCDINPERFKGFPSVPHYEDSRELIRSGKVDAVIIATPHYDHTTIGIDALDNGLHVLVEKPISVHKADAEKLIAAHRNNDQVFAAMFNQRTRPDCRKVRQLIQDGELGEIRRVNWIITSWFRTEAYYRSGGWRATWSGEGGGVLLNQCPHNLDLLQWMCGMPTKIRAFGGLGKYHNIEVEDEITAYMEYENGATGVFITTTAEAPGTNRLEIAGEQGKLVMEDGRITFTRNEIPMSTYSRETRNRFGKPDVWNVDVPVQGEAEQHLGILKNFANAIRTDAPLIARAEEGIHSIELANAMLYSMLNEEIVDFPLDGAAFEAQLQDLIRNSTFKKEVDETTDLSLDGSF